MKMITTIAKLPLETFVDCLVDEDFSGLVIEGVPTQEEIASAWEDILIQYADAIGDYGYRSYLKAEMAYRAAEIKYNKACTYIEMLNYYYINEKVVIPKWIAELNKLISQPFVFDKEDLPAYEKYLSGANSRNKSNLFMMEMKREQYLAILKVQQTEKNEKPDRDYFEKVLINLSDFKKREILINNISTHRFCVLVNQYSQYMRHAQTEKLKK
jgi:hypothetical protein